MTGEVKPCIRCGAQERNGGGSCLPCRRISAAKYRSNHLEMFAAYQSRYAARNPEKNRARIARWKAKNPEKVRAKDARFHAANPEKRRAVVRTCRTKRKTAQAILHLKAVFREINERTCHAAN